ncbi:MAG: hypothetical protein R3A52_10670 [Polyangiales bacterium]
MTLRSLAVLSALTLLHCNHDLSAPTTPATVTSAPAVLTPVATEPTTAAVANPAAAPWMLVSHGGRRFAVLRADIPSEGVVGPATMIERAPHAGPVVFSQRPAPAAVPAELGDIEGAAVLLHQRDGAVCRATLSAPTVLTRYDAEDPEDMTWEGVDEEGQRTGPRATDAQVIEQLLTMVGESDRLLVAELSTTGCASARWAHDERRAPGVFRREALVGSDAAVALAAFRASSAWAETQSQYRESYRAENGSDPPAARALWDASARAPEVYRWTPSREGHRFVTVRAEIPHEGCGMFSAAQWAVFEETDRGLVRRTSASEGADFTAEEAADLDGDGTPEFISDDGVARAVASGIERTVSTTVPYRGCSC